MPAHDEATVLAPPSGRVPNRTALSANPRRIGTLLGFATLFLMWLLIDWYDSLVLIYYPSQRANYLGWVLLQVLAVVSVAGGHLVLLKARLRWSRMVFATTLIALSALVQAGAVLLFVASLPDPAEDRLLWLGTWRVWEVSTLMWISSGVTALNAACVLVAAYYTEPDGTARDFRRVVRNWCRGMLVSPLSVAFGPIFLKEIRVSGRRVGTYWMRGLYVVALVGLISLLYFSFRAGESLSAGVGAQQLESLQVIAPALAVAIAWFQYVLLLLLAAALTAPSICDERRTRTLSALMTTPMNSAQIVFGKLFSRLTMLFILALISVPFLLGARIFGGLDAEHVLAMTAVTLASTLFMASLGTLFSIWSRKAAPASMMAIFTYLLIQFGPVLVILLLIYNAGVRRGPPEEIFLVSSPITLAIITTQVTGAGGPMIPVGYVWPINVGLNLLFSIITLFVASAALRRVMLSDPTPAASKPRRVKRRRAKTSRSPGSVAVAGGAAVDGGELAASDPNQQGAIEIASPLPPEEEVFIEREREVWDQPVLWREVRQPALGSRRNLIVAIVVVVLASFWLYSEVSPGDDDAYPFVTAIIMVTLCFASALSTTSGVSSEKEASTWQVLLSTPLSPLEILGAKLVGAIRRHWFIAAVLFAHIGLGVLAAGLHPIVLVHLLMVILGVTVLLAGTGLLLGMLVQRPLAAMLLNVMFAGTIWAGILILGAILMEILWRRGTVSDDLAAVALSINPVYMAVTAVASAGRFSRSGNFHYDFPGGNLSMWEFTGVLGLTSALGVGLGLAALYAACAIFKARSGRTS